MPQLQPLCSALLSEHGFRHGFSPRQGGESLGPYTSCNLGRGVGDDPTHVEANRQRFAAAIGYAEPALFELSQVHGREVRCVESTDEPAELRTHEGDGLVALGRSVAGQTALGVRTADCLPVLLADPVTRSVAALHAGWRGTALAIASLGVERLCARVGATATPRRLVAAVFPHIRACCFEVSDDVAETLASAAPGERVVSRPGGTSAKPHVDLLAIVLQQLMAAGLDPARIEDVDGCTACEPERFFSYRRDGQRSGRHLTAIVAG